MKVIFLALNCNWQGMKIFIMYMIFYSFVLLWTPVIYLLFHSSALAYVFLFTLLSMLHCYFYSRRNRLWGTCWLPWVCSYWSIIYVVIYKSHESWWLLQLRTFILLRSCVNKQQQVPSLQRWFQKIFLTYLVSQKWLVTRFLGFL